MKRKPIKRVRIGGRYYEYVGDAKLPPKLDGWCDAPNVKGKKIKIRKSLKGKRRLETIIHEGLHAGNWSLDEEHITELGEDLATFLWNLGYRPTGEGS